MNIFTIKKLEKSNGCKIFHLIACTYLATVFTAIVQASHLMTARIPFTQTCFLFSGGTLIIPIAFFIQNITTEVYGYTKSRHLVQVTLFIVAIAVFYQYGLTFLPVSKHMPAVQHGYRAVFSVIPIHIIAFIISAFFGNIINDYIISKTKIYFHGKYLLRRFMMATIIGEAFYMMIASLTWLPYLSFKTQFWFLTISYIYRIIFEAATLPLSYWLVQFIKNYEKIDVYDTQTRYNPFLLHMSDDKDHE